jgi:hypothetical protein
MNTKLIIRLSLFIFIFSACIIIIRLYIGYCSVKQVDLEFADYAYDSYVSRYYTFPENQDKFQKFLVYLALDRGKDISYLRNNPLLDQSIYFNVFEDSIKILRAVLFTGNNETLKKIDHVSIDNYSFIHYITKSKSLLLFERPATICGGSRRIKLFSYDEPLVCRSDLEALIIRNLKALMKNQDDMRSLVYGDQDKCYQIKATFFNNSINFVTACTPEDSIWIDQSSLLHILKKLEISFNTPVLSEFVDYFYFPVIVKNTKFGSVELSRD